MDKRPSFDLGIVAPILLGVFSIIGIGAVLLIGRYSETRVPVQGTATETPFKYLYLGTEPAITTLTPENTETPLPTDNSFSTEPPLPIFESTNTPTPISGVRTATPRLSGANTTPTITLSPTDVIYDDTDLRFIYDGDWVNQSNVSGVHQNSLHISLSVDNSVLFTFVGQQVRVSFQTGPSLGQISINVDGVEYEVDQANSVTQIREWQSALLVQGTHTLLIKHIGGGSVNLDSVTVILIPTKTPTSTNGGN